MIDRWDLLNFYKIDYCNLVEIFLNNGKRENIF